MLLATGDPFNDALVFLIVNWPITLAVTLGTLGVCWLLPRPKPTPRILGTLMALGGLAVGAFVFLPTLGQASGLTPESFLFYSFALLAIVAAGAMIVQRDAARAAIAFAVVVLATCGLFLLLAAPFLMAATIIIYAGAIIVTFLFVIMLSRQHGPSDADDRSREPGLATLASFVFLGLLMLTLQRTYTTPNLDKLLAKAVAASITNDEDHLAEALTLKGDKSGRAYFDALEVEVERLRGQPEAYRIVRPLADEAATSFDNRLKKFAKSKEDLAKLAECGPRVRAALGTLRPSSAVMSSYSGTPANVAAESVQRDSNGRALVPAANVSAIGRSLFTDYLLAVELGGTILLVATIGAIAISARRSEVPA